MPLPRVAFVSTMEGFPWGGSEELWSQAALELRRRGAPVAASVKHWPDPVNAIRRLREAGCVLQERGDPRQRSWWRDRWIRSEYDGHRNWIRSFQPDLVVISQGLYTHGLPWAEACLADHVPFVLIAHSLRTSAWPSAGEAARWRHVGAQAKTWFFVDEHSLAGAQDRLGATIENAGIVRNPYQAAYDTAFAWPDEPGTTRAACVGRLHNPTKGYDLLLHALTRPAWRTRPMEIDFFGTGPNQWQLETMARRYGINGIRFHGHVDDIGRIWHTHHVLLMPSREESLPLTVVEAMLHGRVCIVTDVGGLRTVIEDRVNGFLAEAPTAEHFAHAMEHAWSRRDAWPDIGRAARQRIRAIVPANPVGVFLDQLNALVSQR